MNQPLKITAYLKCGFSAAFDWSISIDGIIAYQSQLEKLGFEEFALTQSSGNLKPIDDLPIEKEHFNGEWWYQCSRPLFDLKLLHTKHLHRRLNVQEAETMVTKIGKIETTKGAYKNARLAKNMFITPCVQWYVNGDKEKIRHFLNMVTHIGGNRGSGHGAVSRWTIESHDSLEDCRFRRCLPVQFAEDRNIQGMYLNWSIRPPATLKENQFDVVMPENAGQ